MLPCTKESSEDFLSSSVKMETRCVLLYANDHIADSRAACLAVRQQQRELLDITLSFSAFQGLS